jgi:hypothetical protein
MGPVLVHTASITRKATVAGSTNGRQAMPTTPLYTNVPCLALPMSAVAAVQNGFDVGQAWTVMFNDGQDVKAGDKITVNGMSLIARGIKPFADLPIVGHVEVSAETENANGQ